MFQLLKPFLWKYCQLVLISFADRESKWNIKFSIPGCQIIVYLIFQRRDVTMGMGSHVLPSIIAITTAWAVSSLLYWAVFNISAFLAMDAFHTFLLQTQQISQEKLLNVECWCLWLYSGVQSCTPISAASPCFSVSFIPNFPTIMMLYPNSQAF